MTTESTPVSAFSYETGAHVGDYNSIMGAARKLFIRNHTTIWRRLTSKSDKPVESYKGQKYKFEKIS